MPTPPCGSPNCHAGIVFRFHAVPVVEACSVCNLFATDADAAAAVEALLEGLATLYYQRNGGTVADALDVILDPTRSRTL